MNLSHSVSPTTLTDDERQIQCQFSRNTWELYCHPNSSLCSALSLVYTAIENNPLSLLVWAWAHGFGYVNILRHKVKHVWSFVSKRPCVKEFACIILFEWSHWPHKLGIIFTPLWRQGRFRPGQVAQLVGASSQTPKGCSSIPSQGTCLGCRWDPWLEHVQEANDQCFSFTSMFVSLLSLSLFPPFFPL